MLRQEDRRQSKFKTSLGILSKSILTLSQNRRPKGLGWHWDSCEVGEVLPSKCRDWNQDPQHLPKEPDRIVCKPSAGWWKQVDS